MKNLDFTIELACQLAVATAVVVLVETGWRNRVIFVLLYVAIRFTANRRARKVRRLRRMSVRILGR